MSRIELPLAILLIPMCGLTFTENTVFSAIY